MKFNEKWLREWVDPPISTAELVEQLTRSGLTVESAEPVVGRLEHVVVASVVSVTPHPGADRLRLCQVDAGTGELLSVVCGAANVCAGMKAPLAMVGARLPDGTKIRKSKIRGEPSNGMLCSPDEIGLGEDHDGIIALAADAPIGQSLVEYLDLDDVVIDVELTPNRGDCLGIAGIAREVGTLNRLEVGGPDAAPVPASIDAALPVYLEAPADCPRYVARVIRGIDPAATSPLWLTERLRRCGVRSLSPVVDVTNYVMLELGQPMHAFDLETLDRAIRVRRAAPGESLTLLDGTVLELDATALVIADESHPVALAGVMGGAETGVSATSRNILLESAWFLPKTIAVEARSRGLHTDASHRFERGVASDLQRRAAERATALLLDIVGGEAGPIIEQLEPACMPPCASIALRSSRITRLLGLSVADEVVSDITTRLGMTVNRSGPGEWQITAPAFRPDITMEADVIEEVARIQGYDAIPDESPSARLAMTSRPESDVSPDRIRDCLVRRGYQEAVTFSFVDAALQGVMDPLVESIPLANPISSDLAVMRTLIWPGLVRAMLYNTNRQRSRVRLFETGLVFRREAGEIRQDPVVAGLATGPAHPEQWGAAHVDCDFFDIKADVEALLAHCGDPAQFEFRPAEHPALHPGRSARIEQNGHFMGHIGAIHPGISQDWKHRAPVFLFQLDLEMLRAGHLPRFEALSKHPAVRRDLAVIVDESVTAEQVSAMIGQAGVDVLEKLELFDVYRGEGIDSGRKSLALGLTFQHGSRTLEDAEIDRGIETILNSLAKHLGGELRG